MAHTSTLRKQHDLIQALVKEIGGVLDSVDTEFGASRVMALLKRFDSLLRTHLASEDKLLYPSMMSSEDLEASQMARRYSEEMGGLVDCWDAFAQDWLDVQVIRQQPGIFIAEWKTFISALNHRIEKENFHLYPLADRINDAGGKLSA